MSATIFSIAEIAGVSPSAVSLALRESPKISKKTKLRVKAVARELNYQPNMIAKNLAMGKTHTIGAILPDALNPIYTETTNYIEEFCSKEGYEIFTYFVNGDTMRERKFLETVYKRQVDGLIIIPSCPESNQNYLCKLEEDAVPMVIRDVIEWLPNTDYVSIDLEEGAYIATKHLIDSGHRKIACVHSEFALGRTGGRVKGYKKALAESGIVFDETLIMPCGIRPIDGYTVTKKILSGKDATAIFMHNDLLAIGAFKAIREKGLKVPDDIAMVGFDNLEIDEFLEVPLTSVAHPKAEVGRLLGQTIIERIRHGEAEVKHILVKPELAIRESSGDRKGRHKNDKKIRKNI